MGRREAGPEEVLGAVLFPLPDKVLILPPWLPRARLLGLPASLWPQMAGTGLLQGSLFRKKVFNPIWPKSILKKAL